MSEPVGNVPRNPSDIPGNSHRSQRAKQPQQAAENAEPEKLEKVVVGQVIKRKTPWYKKLTTGFIAEDAGSIGDFVLDGVIKPAVKNLIRDVIVGTTDRALYSGGRAPGRPGVVGQAVANTVGTTLRTSYRNGPEQRPGITQTARATHNFGDIILPSRDEALSVIEGLANHARNFGQASVADMYDLLGLTADWTDRSWGWGHNELQVASIQQIREGWLLVLPPTQQLR